MWKAFEKQTGNVFPSIKFFFFPCLSHYWSLPRNSLLAGGYWYARDSARRIHLVAILSGWKIWSKWQSEGEGEGGERLTCGKKWIYTYVLEPRLWFAILNSFEQSEQSRFWNSCLQFFCFSTLSILSFNFFPQYQFHNISAYPAYHTIHDTFYYVKTFVDPQFSTHLAIARIWVSTAFLLAETPVLPINCSDYAAALKKGFRDINTKYGKTLDQKGISLGK